MTTNNPVTDRARAFAAARLERQAAAIPGHPSLLTARMIREGKFDGHLWVQEAAAFERDILAGQSVGDAFPNIGPDPMKADGPRDKAAAEERLKQAYVMQQAGVPNQMALVWRVDLGDMRSELLRLRSIVDRAATPASDSPAIPELDRGGENLALKYRQDQQRRDQINENVREMEARLQPTPASHTAPDALRVDYRGIVFDALQRMRRAGESYEMGARWAAEDIRAALATPTPSRDEVKKCRRCGGTGWWSKSENVGRDGFSISGGPCDHSNKDTGDVQ